MSDPTPTPAPLPKKAAAINTLKATGKASVLLMLISAIPEPYQEEVLLAWVAIAIACTDLTPPVGHGRWQWAFMLAYRVLNFLAFNFGTAANALFALIGQRATSPSKDKQS